MAWREAKSLARPLSFAIVILITTVVSNPSASAGTSTAVFQESVLGFDRSTTPSTSQMDDWGTNSPYFSPGDYVGGPNYSGDHSNLTSGWLTHVMFGGGFDWDLIPIWVPKQAPCLSFLGYSVMSTNTGTAFNQGGYAADSASTAAQAVGINPGAILYVDIEGYDIPGCTDEATSQAAVKHFVSGWTKEAHILGYSAGAYGSTCASHVTDWASVDYVINDLWGAYYNGTLSVWGLSCLDDGLWNGASDRRLHQYDGNVSEHWGSTTMTVDEDCENGLVAGPNYGTTDTEPSGGGQTEDNC